MVVVVIAAVGYFKNLTVENKRKTASSIRDYGTTAAVVGLKLGKDAVRGSYNLGKIAADEVQINHQDVIDSVYSTIEEAKSNHGGSVKKLGVSIADNIEDTLYFKDAGATMADIMKRQAEQLNK